MKFQVSKPVLAGNELKYVQEAMAGGWISGYGSFVAKFEAMVSEYLGLEHGTAVCNGTAALQLAFRSLDLRPGDEVIVPAFTYVACPNAVAYSGGHPVFADCDRATRNLTVETIESAWTPRTRGVLLVHLFGVPGPVEDIRQYCQRRGLWLVEDCAQSFGAKVDGRSTGSFGDVSIFSFYSNKVISTGEGGMIFARDPRKHQLIRSLHDQGSNSTQHYIHLIQGYNHRMHNLAAAIGCGQMEMADYHVRERRRIADRYRRNLKPLEDRGIAQLPAEPFGTLSVYWLYSVVLRGGGRKTTESVRDRARKEFGIETRPFYVPMHKLPIYRREVCLPHAEFLGEHGIVLPTYSGLTDAEVDEISDALITCLEAAQPGSGREGHSRP